MCAIGVEPPGTPMELPGTTLASFLAPPLFVCFFSRAGKLRAASIPNAAADAASFSSLPPALYTLCSLSVLFLFQRRCDSTYDKRKPQSEPVRRSTSQSDQIGKSFLLTV